MWGLSILFTDQATWISFFFIATYLNSLKIIKDLIVNFSCIFSNQSFRIFVFQRQWLFFTYGVLVQAVLPKTRLNVNAGTSN